MRHLQLIDTFVVSFSAKRKYACLLRFKHTLRKNIVWPSFTRKDVIDEIHHSILQTRPCRLMCVCVCTLYVEFR